MKTTLRLEELAMFLISFCALYYFQVAWWWYLLLLLGPDISFIGYAGGNKTGAIVYNIFHHKAIGLLLIFISVVSGKENSMYMYAGIVLFGHSSMDRFFGYGLKHFEGFNYTHLGKIGKNKL